MTPAEREELYSPEKGKKPILRMLGIKKKVVDSKNKTNNLLEKHYKYAPILYETYSFKVHRNENETDTDKEVMIYSDKNAKDKTIKPEDSPPIIWKSYEI